MDALIAILAGGHATRLAGRKASAELAGRPLISYPLAAALGSGHEVVVVAKADTELPDLGQHVLHEPLEPRHPLCGIVAGVREAGGRPLVVLACDMPFVTADLLAWLASLADPLAVPCRGGRLQPLLGRYDPSLLPRLESALGEDRPLQETVASLDPRLITDVELGRFGDPERLLINVNTAAELEAAGKLAEPGRVR
jgi:molybdopterin-guanine dinucleotide biosynthesis protein A